MGRGSSLGSCALLGTLALLLAGCGGRSSAVPSDGGAATVRVIERDFAITVARHELSAGRVVFRIVNNGPDRHELIVVHDDGRLKLRSDGMTVDEEALQRLIVGGVEPGPKGDVRELAVDLTPGRYMLLCNMYGHYMGGMHQVVVVT
jgi:uncharacterized cupredoxin-like copper-binding protein